MVEHEKVKSKSKLIEDENGGWKNKHEEFTHITFQNIVSVQEERDARRDFRNNQRLQLIKQQGRWPSSLFQNHVVANAINTTSASTSISSILYPGVIPGEYGPKEVLVVRQQNAHSPFTKIPIDYFALIRGGSANDQKRLKNKRQIYSLGDELLGTTPTESSPLDGVFRAKVSVDDCSPFFFGNHNHPIHLNLKQVRQLRKMIQFDYRIYLTLDRLPVVTENNGNIGIPVGFVMPPSFTGLLSDAYYLYNHYQFTITYEEETAASNFEEGIIRILGFKVRPFSILHLQAEGEGPSSSHVSSSSCPSFANNDDIDLSSFLEVRINPDKGNTIPNVAFTYQVRWVKQEPKSSSYASLWEDRYDSYMLGWIDSISSIYDTDDPHRLTKVSSMTSLVILFALFGMFWKSLTRRKGNQSRQEESSADSSASSTTKELPILSTQNGSMAKQDQEKEENNDGWKLLAGDVFRPPTILPVWFSIVLGIGAHIGISVFILLLSSVIGYSNPMRSRTFFVDFVVVNMIFGGFVAGYVSAKSAKYCCQRYTDTFSNTEDDYTSGETPKNYTSWFSLFRETIKGGLTAFKAGMISIVLRLPGFVPLALIAVLLYFHQVMTVLATVILGVATILILATTLALFIGCVMQIIGGGLYIVNKILSYTKLKMPDVKKKPFRTCFCGIASAFPGICFGSLLLQKVLLWCPASDHCVSVPSLRRLTQLLIVWFCIYTPLCLFGSIYGFNHTNQLGVPCKTNEVERKIPPTPSWESSTWATSLFVGFFVYAPLFNEVDLILLTLPLGFGYYDTFYLLWSFLVCTICIAGGSIWMMYVQVCNQDHQVWWKTLLRCSAAGLYIFIHAMWRCPIDPECPLSLLVYILQMGIISLSFAAYCGTMGIFCSFWFAKCLYSSLTPE